MAVESRRHASFHLDDENLGPHTWFRRPILGGGFSHELNNLAL